MRHLAVGGDSSPQPEHTAKRHILHIHLADGVCGIGGMLADRIHAVCSAAHHLVDNAADMYSHHHLHTRMVQGIQQAQENRGTTNYTELALPSLLLGISPSL